MTKLSDVGPSGVRLDVPVRGLKCVVPFSLFSAQDLQDVKDRLPADQREGLLRAGKDFFAHGGQRLRFVPEEDAPRRRGVLKPQAPLPACLSKDAPAAESGEGESLLHRMKEEARATANKMADEAKAKALQLQLYKTAVHQDAKNPELLPEGDRWNLLRDAPVGISLDFHTPHQIMIGDKVTIPSGQTFIVGFIESREGTHWKIRGVEVVDPPKFPPRQPQPFVPWTEEVMNDAVLAYVRKRISEAGVKLLARRQSLDPSYCENAEHELSHWQGVLKYVEEKLK